MTLCEKGIKAALNTLKNPEHAFNEWLNSVLASD